MSLLTDKATLIRGMQMLMGTKMSRYEEPTTVHNPKNPPFPWRFGPCNVSPPPPGLKPSLQPK